jgi:hypothetical protein
MVFLESKGLQVLLLVMTKTVLLFVAMRTPSGCMATFEFHNEIENLIAILNLGLGEAYTR